MGKAKRFEIIHSESPEGGMMMSSIILLDTLTGVQYLQLINGYGGGLTPLLDADGKPIVWDVSGRGDLG